MLITIPISELPLGDGYIFVDIVIEPPERFAVKFLFQCKPIADVPVFSDFWVSNCFIVEFLVLVKPGFGDAVSVPTIASFLTLRPLRKKF